LSASDENLADVGQLRIIDSFLVAGVVEEVNDVLAGVEQPVEERERASPSSLYVQVIARSVPVSVAMPPEWNDSRRMIAARAVAAARISVAPPTGVRVGGVVIDQPAHHELLA
jgi:hypothetical protein